MEETCNLCDASLGSVEDISRAQIYRVHLNSVVFFLLSFTAIYSLNEKYISSFYSFQILFFSVCFLSCVLLSLSSIFYLSLLSLSLSLFYFISCCLLSFFSDFICLLSNFSFCFYPFLCLLLSFLALQSVNLLAFSHSSTCSVVSSDFLHNVHSVSVLSLLSSMFLSDLAPQIHLYLFFTPKHTFLASTNAIFNIITYRHFFTLFNKKKETLKIAIQGNNLHIFL